MRLLVLALVVSGCSPTHGAFAAASSLPRSMAIPAAALTTGPLEIHQINVQQGDCTLIVGPDGTTFLIDVGNVGKGASEFVPDLQSSGIDPADGLDFVFAAHGDTDHLGGLDEVLHDGNYDVHEAVWFSGRSKTGDEISDFLAAVQRKTAGAAQPVSVGYVAPLGGATCVAVGGTSSVSEGLGGGAEDTTCTAAGPSRRTLRHRCANLRDEHRGRDPDLTGWRYWS